MRTPDDLDELATTVESGVDMVVADVLQILRECRDSWAMDLADLEDAMEDLCQYELDADDTHEDEV